LNTNPFSFCIDTVAYLHNRVSFLSAFVSASLGMLCPQSFCRIVYPRVARRDSSIEIWKRMIRWSYAGWVSRCEPISALFFSCLSSSSFRDFARFSTPTLFAVGNHEGLGLETCLGLNAYAGRYTSTHVYMVSCQVQLSGSQSFQLPSLFTFLGIHDFFGYLADRKIEYGSVQVFRVIVTK